MSHAQWIHQYLAGPDMLRESVAGMTPEQLRATPVPGKWSTQQIICHIADFEPVYADRMKRAIASDEPTVMSGDQDAFAAKLA
ncbi:MAG: DinB family protein, partial [Planctomycetia bacterium]|nr:DinB family protein [Planctomycetia bacterium]